MSLIYEKVVTEDLNVGTGTVTVTSPTGGSLSGTQIGLHSFAVGQKAFTATWDPGSIAVGSNATTTVTVPGADLGDHVSVSFSLDIQELGISASVSADDTVEVVLSNNTAAAVDLASGTVSVLVFKVA